MVDLTHTRDEPDPVLESQQAFLELGRLDLAALPLAGVAVRLDERQYHRGLGPCVHARVQRRRDLHPRYRDRRPLRKTLSVGMPVPQRVVGGLNLHASTPAAFDQAATELARAFADYGTVALGGSGDSVSETLG
jgi:hypothetical protein